LRAAKKYADGGDVLPAPEAWDTDTVADAFTPKDPNPFNKPTRPPFQIQGPLGVENVDPGDSPFLGFGRPEDKSYGAVHDLYTKAKEAVHRYAGPGFDEALNKIGSFGSMLAPGSGEQAAMEDTVRTKQALEEGKIGEAAKHGAMGTFNATLGSLPGGHMLSTAVAGVMGVASRFGRSIPKEGLLDTSKFETISSSKGTMPGGFKLDPATGTEWYVKQAPSIEQAKNEKLTAELYKLFNVPVADVRLTTVNGKPGIASRKIEGVQLSNSEREYKDINGLHENYPIHALLANHDTVGTGPENPLGNIMVDPSGTAHVIDTGGGLLYKGTGSKKAKFTPEVDELNTMADPSYSHLSAQVFGDIEHQSEMIGAQKIANVDGKDIARLVEMYGPGNKMDKFKLMSTLLQRKYNIEQHYGVKPEAKSEAKIPESYEPTQEPHMDQVRDPYQQVPFTEEDYNKFANEIPPPVHPDFVEPEKTPLDKLHEMSFAQAIGPKMTNMISDATLNKENLQLIGKSLSKGPYGANHWDAALHLWQIAEHVNPQAAEAVFRNLPPSIQPKVGFAIKALKNKLEYSPFNSVAKGSGKDGKFPLDYNYFSTKTDKFAIPPHLLKDKAFNANIDRYADLLESKPHEAAPESLNPLEGSPQEIHEYLKNLNDPAAAEEMFKGLPAETRKAVDEFIRADNPWTATPTVKAKPKTQYEKDVAEYEAKLDSAIDPPEPLIGGHDSDKWFQQATPFKIDNRFKQLVKPIKNWAEWKPPEQDIKPLNLVHKSKSEIKKLGFNPYLSVHHGSHYPIPDTLEDPFTHKTVQQERGFFSSTIPGLVAENYGHNVTSYVARALKPMEVDWKQWSGMNRYSPKQMESLIEAGHRQGADMIAAHNMRDMGSSKYGLHTQYIFLKTSALRQAMAKFDPTKLHLRNTLAGVAGVAGGGTFVYGNPQKENDKMNRGGVPNLARGGYSNPSKNYYYHPPHPPGMIRSAVPGRTDKLPMSVPPGSYILPADIPSALGQGNTMAGEKILGTMFKTGPYSPQSTAQLSGKLPKSPRPPRMPRLQMIRPIRMGKFADGGQPKLDYRTQDFPSITKHEVTGSYPLTSDLEVTGKAHTFSNDIPLRRKPEDWGASVGLRRTFQEGGAAESEQGDIPIIAAGGEYVIHPDQVREVGHGDLEAGHKVLDRFVIHTRKKHIETLKKLKPPKK
jgi:hypothetical protein